MKKSFIALYDGVCSSLAVSKEEAINELVEINGYEEGDMDGVTVYEVASSFSVSVNKSFTFTQNK